jgi:3-(3-hydroxy-phenyl)propionate hydroxylase
VEAHRIVIVGAGPVGLVAALALAKQGVRCVLLERKPTFNDGSRAICVARHSFHIFEQLGALDPFLEKALGWTTGRTFYHGQQILEFSMPHGENEKFLPMYNIQQQYIEQFLWEAVTREPLIELRWQSEVLDVRTTDSKTELIVEDPTGRYGILSDWLIAADGAHSRIRAARGLRLEGHNHEGRYLIVDVRMQHDYPTIRRALFDPISIPGGTILIHRQPDDIWRIDYQISSDDDVEDAMSEANVRARVASILDEIGHRGFWEIEWWSTYSANTLALRDYRDANVFFVGDSAHIVPIFGVRGLNNGIADAFNLAWKLARVIKGQASDTLLESYSHERRGATLDVFQNAVKSTLFMSPPTTGWRLVRNAALSLALSHDFAKPFANPRQMAPYNYFDSPITVLNEAEFETRGAPGTVVPNIKLGDQQFLTDHFGNGFVGIAFSANESDLQDLTTVLHELDPSFSLITIGAADKSTITVTDTAIHLRFGIERRGFVLIRPDLYIAARWNEIDSLTISKVMRGILGQEAQKDAV